jgi:hypothetical protein
LANPLFGKLKGAMQPQTKYAQSGDVNIAYQTVGAR